MTERKGDWIQTFTGKAFYPLDARPEEIDIRDIAHALSMQCRYGGHTRFFYSVAEHCLHLSYMVPPDVALEALMHDAAEAYLVDVPRPVKKALLEYRTIEAGLERVIASALGLRYPWPDIVMDHDTRILTDERRQIMRDPPIPWSSDTEPLGVRIYGFAPQRAESEFLRRYEQLKQKSPRGNGGSSERTFEDV